MLPYRDSRFVRIVLFTFFAGILFYGYYEVRNVFFGPSIDVGAEAITTSEPIVHIIGHAERLSELNLNGRRITVTESGDFDEPFVLAEGSNRIVLEARDVRNRTTRKTIDIIYIPEAAAGR